MSLHDFMDKIVHNLFQPLLLFFYMGFLIPILRVGFEFPHQVYQGLVIFLLVSIGWHGGEELAALEAHELYQALGFMAVGFVVNFRLGWYLCHVRWCTGNVAGGRGHDGHDECQSDADQAWGARRRPAQDCRKARA
jgi:hypothetical protein